MQADTQIFEELRVLRDLLPEGTTIEGLIYKAKKEELMMEPKIKKLPRKQVGALIDATLWSHLRAQSILEGRNAGELLDDSIKMYLHEINQGEQGQRKKRK